MVKAKETKTKTTTESRMLKVNLTEKELLEAGQQLVAKLDDFKTVQADRDSVNKGYKAKEAEIEARITSLQIMVRNKYEVRSVECDNVQDFKALECFVIRKDTGEEILRRKLTSDEKQSDLPFDGETDGEQN